MSRLLASVSLFCLCAASARAADLTIHTPSLASVDNFRDVAGTTALLTTTQYDGVMREGVFYRSNALTLNAADLATINTLGLGLVIDLRQPSEIATTPDVMPAGASYLNVNVLAAANLGALTFSSVAESVTYMEDINRELVRNATVRTEFAKVLMALATEDDAALFHCTAGKDRTGWTAAILQMIAGVSDADVMANYMATNDYTAARVAATMAQLTAAYGPGFAAIYEPLLGVKTSYLQAGLDQMVADYGDLDSYLKNGLGLDQATIYVLRGKMVRYHALPGDGTYGDNAAAGSALLQALQDTDLAGDFTAYNYYLQTAIDAGSLGGVQRTVGGQVHADAGAFLLRLPQRVEDAAAAQTRVADLPAGGTRYWFTGFGGYQDNGGGGDAAGSAERNAGGIAGVTHRYGDSIGVDVMVGYEGGKVRAAGGEVRTDAVVLGFGGRYGFGGLGQGLFVAGGMDAVYIDYDSSRDIGGGLGTAGGDTSGFLAGVTAEIGYLMSLAPVSVEPRFGLRLVHLGLDGFTESGSEVALDIDSLEETQVSLIAGLRLALTESRFGAWTLVPVLSFGYEHAFDGAGVTSEGRLLGLAVTQDSAYANRDLFRAGLSFEAMGPGVRVNAGIQGLGGDDSAGVGGNLSVGLTF